MTVRRMRIACWISKDTHTHKHSQYVIFIAFPLQQWLQERASMLPLRTLLVLFLFNRYGFHLSINTQPHPLYFLQTHKVYDC